MTGEAHWLSLTLMLLAAVPVGYLWIRNWREERKYLVEELGVRCRARGNRLAQCTLVRDAKSHEPIGVRSCSALTNPEDVRCGRTCLPLFAAA